MQLEGQQIIQVSLSNKAVSLIAKCTRSSTKTKYASIISKWRIYCSNSGYSTTATTNTYVNFLASEFDRHLKYSYLRSYNAALSEFITQVDTKLLNKLLKGIHNERPSTPRYCVIWDVNTVLTFMSAMRTDTLMLITQKLATLFMILSGNRVNMLTHMHITSMILSDDECTFTFNVPLKHTRPGKMNDKMTFKAYSDKSLCPVHVLKQYLDIRAELCSETNLFITTRKPYHGAHHDTIARWVKEILCATGIDTRKYQAHSCRAASTSTAALKGVSLTTIIKSASWSNVSTFKRFYHKEIETGYESEESNFGNCILNQHK